MSCNRRDCVLHMGHNRKCLREIGCAPFCQHLRLCSVQLVSKSLVVSFCHSCLLPWSFEA
eukprot:5087191-Amphidinium_carterae.1